MTKSDAIQVYTYAAKKLDQSGHNLSKVECDILTLAMLAAGAILENKVKLVAAQ